MSLDKLSETDREQSLVCARLLRLGRSLTRIARVSVFLVGAPVLPVLLGLVSAENRSAQVWAAFALLGWATAELLGWRLQLDRRLFEDFAAGRLSPSSLDTVLGLPQRAVALRVAGAQKLLRMLGAYTGCLAVLALASVCLA